MSAEQTAQTWSRGPAPEVNASQVFPDDPSVLPEGSSVDGRAARRPVDDVADYVIIGSGAAGATVAARLSERGYKVVLLEEGPWVRTKEFTTELYPAMKRMFRRNGTGVIMGRSTMILMQGRCVGGSTTINSAIAWRPPEEVLQRWATEFQLGKEFTLPALAPYFDRLEKELSVRSVADEAMGEGNAFFGVAAANKKYAATRIQRYDAGCKGSSGCLTGCRHGRKLSMNITYVPRALREGGKIYYSTRVDRVEFRGGRAVAVLAMMDGAELGPMPLRVRARRGVFVAASTIQTPNVLRRSGLRSEKIGMHFQAHPGVACAGFFDRPVGMDFGAAQGFNSLHFTASDHIKLETIMLPPELAIARLPFVGSALMERLAAYDRMLTWAVVLKAEAQGTVKGEGPLGDMVSYTPTPKDMTNARKGLKILSEMFFDVGAKELYPGVHGMPKVMTRDQLHLWDDASIDPQAYTLMASHLFGAARMGKDPSKSVVGTDFQTHEARGLYVVDSSVFPTNLGVNPQHTIMAMASMAVEQVLRRPLPEV